MFPGLIDAHCHVGISEEKWGSIGDDCNEAASPLTPYLRGLDAVNPMDSAFHDAIMAGITSVMTGPGSANIAGGQFVVMKVQGRVMDRMILKAPAAMKIAFGENPKVNYGDKGRMPCSRMAIAALLREELYEAKEYWEQKKRGQCVPIEFRKECWIPVLEGKIPLKAHVRGYTASGRGKNCRYVGSSGDVNPLSSYLRGFVCPAGASYVGRVKGNYHTCSRNLWRIGSYWFYRVGKRCGSCYIQRQSHGDFYENIVYDYQWEYRISVVGRRLRVWCMAAGRSRGLIRNI